MHRANTAINNRLHIRRGETISLKTASEKLHRGLRQILLVTGSFEKRLQTESEFFVSSIQVPVRPSESWAL